MYPVLLRCGVNTMVGTGFIDFPPGNSITATIFNYAVKLVPLWIQTDVLANSSGMKTYYKFGKMHPGVENVTNHMETN